MTTISNVQRTNQAITYWLEDGEEFFVTLNAQGKPASVQSKRGKWVEQTCNFVYDVNGKFLSMTSDLETTLLSHLVAQANGTVLSSTNLTGEIENYVASVRAGNTTRKGLNAALLGDSFSARNTTTGSACRDLDWGYFSWAQAIMGGPFKLVLNAGISGQRTDEILLRTQSVIDASPDWVFVQGGINDRTYGIAQGIPLATTVGNVVRNLKQICSLFAGYGINVVLLSVAPNTQAAGNNTYVQTVNAALREWCQQNAKGVIFVDTYAAMVNPTSTTGALATGMSDDALHPSSKGARAMGKAIANSIQSLIPNRAYLPSSAAESYSIDVACKQIVDNPLMTGTGPAVSGTGASGNVPTGWLGGTGGAGATSAVFSVGNSRVDGIGFDLQAVVVGAASGSSINIRQTGLVGRAAIGDSLYCVGQITVTGMTDVKSINLGGSVVIDGVTYSINCLEPTVTTGVDQGDITLTFKSNEQLLFGSVITGISLVASVTFGTSGSGAATVKFGRIGMFKR